MATQPAQTSAPAAVTPDLTVLARRHARPAWLVPVVTIWAATRLLAITCAWIASWLVAHHWLRHHEPGLRAGVHPFDVLGGWDGAWYAHVARAGYPAVVHSGHQSALAFFPLLPLLLAGLTHLGVPAVGAGLVIGNLAALAGFCAVAATTEILFDSNLAERTAVYLAISPLGFVLAMAYTEAIALACSFGAIALALRRRYAAAALLALLAGLTRPTGLLIALPLAVLAARRARSEPGAVAAALAPIVGVGLFCAYLWAHTGDPLAFSHVQAAWGRGAPSAVGLAGGFDRAVDQLQHAGSLWALRDVVLGGLTVGLLAYGAWRRFPPEWLAFGLLTLALPLASDSTQSLGRFGLLAVPAFWALAMLGRRSMLVDQSYRLLAPALFAAGVLTLPLHWP